MQDPLSKLPGYALRRAASATAAELHSRLEPLGLRQVSVSMLLLIKGNPNITASALGRQLDIQRANMVPLLKRLEDAQLIDRKPIDGKSQGLVLTQAGHDLTQQAQSIVDCFEAELLDRIPAKHRDHLLPALDALWR